LIDAFLQRTAAYCSSLIIEQQKLLNAVKDDLQAIAKDTVKAETLFGVVEGKVAESQGAVAKELKRLEKQINETNARFDSLLTLHVNKAFNIIICRRRSRIRTDPAMFDAEHSVASRNRQKHLRLLSVQLKTNQRTAVSFM